MGGFVLRVKFKNGQKIVDGLTPQDNILKLKKKLAEVTGLSERDLCVLAGFPPKALDLGEDNATLQDLNIRTGETLIIEEKKNSDFQVPPTRVHIADNSEMDECPGILMKMVVPADDSCLFTSVGFALSGKYIKRLAI